MIATDGVFSMDGIIADLAGICDLADRYDALVMVDDSHAVGFVGPRRTRHARVSRRHGARRHPHRHAGQGAGRRAAAATPGRAGDHRAAAPASRPYLFSNSLAPPIVGGLAEGARARRAARPSCATGSRRTPRWFRGGMTEAGLRHRAGRRIRSCRSCSATRPSRPPGRAAVGAGRLRDRLLLPGRAAGQGADPHPDLGGPHPRRHRLRRRAVRCGQGRARALRLRRAQASTGSSVNAGSPVSGWIARKWRSSNVAIDVVSRRAASATSEASVRLTPRSR